MKHLSFVILLTFLCFIVTGCTSSDYTKYPFYDMEIQEIDHDEGMRAIPYDFSHLDSVADCIVQGKVSGDGEVRKTGGLSPFTVTISSLEITKVYKGNLKEGKHINLNEFYYVDEDNVLHQAFSYMPCEVGKEYLFFLIRYGEIDNWENTYSIWSLEFGRFPVIDTKARSANNIGDIPYTDFYLKSDSKFYRELFQGAYEKYMK